MPLPWFGSMFVKTRGPTRRACSTGSPGNAAATFWLCQVDEHRKADEDLRGPSAVRIPRCHFRRDGSSADHHARQFHIVERPTRLIGTAPVTPVLKSMGVSMTPNGFADAPLRRLSLTVIPAGGN